MRKLSSTLESLLRVVIRALYVSCSSNKPSGKSSIKSKSLNVGDDFARSLLLAYKMILNINAPFDVLTWNIST